jgi:thioredoxin reductase
VAAAQADLDCIVVGGGAAGLSAALVLGRARRSTLLVDAGEPSNGIAEGIGGLLGQDGRPPADLYAQGRDELSKYPSVEVRAGEAIDAERANGSFRVGLADGSHVTASRLLLATGMEYRPPEVPGIAERWGRSAFHCPFCHGWEVRGKAIGVLDPGATGLHRAHLIRAWTDRVTLLGNGPLGLDGGEAERLAAAGVEVEERPITGLRGDAPALEAVVFDDGEELACEALLVATTLHRRSDLANRLGVSPAPPSPLTADAVAVDGKFETEVPGVFAAGDIVPEPPSVATAIAAGSRAAAAIVGDLMGAT